MAGLAPSVKSVVPGAGRRQRGRERRGVDGAEAGRGVVAGPGRVPVSPGTELSPVVMSWKAGEPAASGAGADALATPYCARPTA